MRLKLLLIFIILYSASLKAQQNPTSKEKIKQAVIDRAKLIDNSLVKNIQFENIGPTVMSGRVVDLAVNPENPTEF